MILGKKKGVIIVNPFGIPKQSIIQAERLKYELKELGVETEIDDNAFSVAGVERGRCLFELSADFAVFLDKDKYLSGILDNIGLRLFNRHSAIRVCDDKGETYIRLSGTKVSLPKTVFAPLCYDKSAVLASSEAERIEKTFNYPVVLKESYGSMGKGVYLAKNREELEELVERLKTVPHLYQEYLGKKFGTDYRVIVIGGKAAACMERKNEKDFRSNIALGGTGRSISVDDERYSEYIATAEYVAKSIGLDYCGVDLLEGNTGEPVVCEVNSNAFFIEMEKVTGVNVGKLYAEYIAREINKV